MQLSPPEANSEAAPRRNMPETPSYIVSSHLAKAFSTFGGGIEKGQPAWIANGSRLGSEGYWSPNQIGSMINTFVFRFHMGTRVPLHQSYCQKLNGKQMHQFDTQPATQKYRRINLYTTLAGCEL